MSITQGRTVLFRQPDGEPRTNGISEHPAIVTRVWSEQCVNLQVLFDAAPVEVRTSVVYADKGVGQGYSWRWPDRG